MASDLVDRLRGVKSSQAIKVPCRVATTANISLSGEQTIDGVAVVDGDRVLVKDQTTASENGIYECDTGAWDRAPDWDGIGDVVTGTRVFITAGSANRNFDYRVTTTGTITVGTTSVALEAVGASTTPDWTSLTDFSIYPGTATDLTDVINTAIASITSGVLIIPPGDYVTTSKIVIANKNDANNAAQSNLQIVAYGARFISGVAAGEVAIEFDDLKYINISGLEMKVSDAVRTAGGAVASFDGLWRSQFVDCKFGDLTASFGEQNLDTFEAHYWSKFVRCDFFAHEFHTGTYASDRTETNAVIFDCCYLGPRAEFGYTGPDYLIKVYGDTGVNAVQYINCDCSYYTIGLIYVDQEIAHPAAHIDFFGGFFDSSGSADPIDTKGLTVNVYGGGQSPSSLTLNTALIVPGSKQTLDIYGGARNGSRLPTSSFNLIKNGDLRDGSTDITLSSGGANITATVTSSVVGLFGQYVNFVTAVNRTVEFTSIPVPFAGVYSFTMVVRNNGDELRTAYKLNSVSTVFDGMNILTDNEWQILSYTTLDAVAAGDVLSMNIFGASTFALNYDIAYFGLTYGRVGQLYAPLHPMASSTLSMADSNKTHRQIIAAGSNLTANRTLTISGGDADRTLDVSAANVTISSAVAPWLNSASARALCASIGTPYALALVGAAGSAHTGTTAETTLATVSIPAGAMGPNGTLMIHAMWTYTNNGNNKTMRVRLGGIGGTAFRTHVATTTLSFSDQIIIANRNSQSSQAGKVAGTAGPLGTSTSNLATATIDTSASVDLVFTAELGNSADSMTLQWYQVYVTYAA